MTNPRRIVLGVLVAGLIAGGAWLCWTIVDVSRQRKAEIEKAALYDVSPLLKVDPALIRYREIRRFPTGLKKPMLLAMREGEILVAGDRSIVRFDDKGRKSGAIALPAEATAMTVDSAGAIHVGLMDHVEIYSLDGKRSASWPTLGDRAQIAGLAITENEVWIADGGRRVVVHAGRDGTIKGEIGDFLIPSPQHMDIAVGKDGTIWVADTGRHQIKAFSANGNMQRFWGEGGVKLEQFTGCCNPADFCIRPDGSFVTGEKGLPRVKKYSADGKFECVVAPPERAEDTSEGIDVAADASGRIILLDRTKKIVRIMEAK